jgi:hypothetical protein
MVLRGVLTALVCTVFLAASSSSMADGYKPDEYLSLDLTQAALSPKLLGPPSQFEPLRVQDKADSQSRSAQAGAEPKAVVKVRAAHVRAEKRHGAARTKLVHKHGNPLDAQAFDTRIQVWPCKSGGICNWQR